MTAIERTAYPRLRSRYTHKEVVVMSYNIEKLPGEPIVVATLYADYNYPQEGGFCCKNIRSR